MNKTLLFFTVFCFGYFFNDVLKPYVINPITKLKLRLMEKMHMNYILIMISKEQ